MADTAVTISDDKISVLSNQERAATGFTHKYHVDYTDIDSGTGSEDTVTMTLGTTPAKFIIDKAAVNVTTAFAGTSAMTIKVGQTDDDASVAATSILTAGVLGTAGLVPAADPGSTGTSAETMKAIFTNSTGLSPSSLTAGALDIYLSINDASRWP